MALNLVIRTSIAATALLLSLLGACGSESGGTSEPEESADPGGALQAAVDRIRETATGEFDAVFVFGVDDPVVRTTGTYDLDTEAATFTVETLGSDGSPVSTIDSIAVEQSLWYRLREWPCWVYVGTDQSSEAPYPAGTPNAVAATLGLTLRDGSDVVDESRVPAEADLAAVAGSVSNKFPTALGIPADADDRVAVGVDVASEDHLSWVAPLETIAHTAFVAGYEPTEKLPDPLIGQIETTVTPGPLDEPIVAPPEDEVIELSADLEKDMEDCGRG